MERLGAAYRRLRRSWPEVVAFAVALAALSYVYLGHDYDRHPGLPRGTGEYRPHLATADGHKIYLSVRSLVYDGDLDLKNDIRRFRYSGGVRHGPDGAPYFPHGLGPVAVWAPLLTLARGAEITGNALGADIPGHGYDLFHQRIVFFSSLLFALGCGLLGRDVARRRGAGRLSASVAALAIVFGTSVYFYATYSPSYSHAASAFFGALFLWAWARGIGNLGVRRFAVLGALLGLAALVRVTGLGLGLVVAIELAARLLRPREGDPAQLARRAALLLGRGLIALGVAVLVLVPQFLLWKAQTGHYAGSPNGAGYVTLSRPMVSELLFSSVNGFFSTHPLAYLGALGLLVAPRRHRLVATALLATLALEVYVNSCVYDWFGMGSFGARRLCGVTFILVVGLAWLGRAAMIAARRVRGGAWACRVVGVAAAAWFVVWNVTFAADYVDQKIPKIQPHATCCKTAPELMQAIAQPVYDRVGNPFAMPASLAFAIRYDTPLKRWDRAVGSYAARPRFPDLRSGTWRTESFYWNVPGVNFTPYLLDGLGPRQRSPERVYRWTTAPAASFLMPLFLAAPHRVSIPIIANTAEGDLADVRFRFNGTEVGRARVGPRWQWVEVTIPGEIVERGSNVMTIATPPRPYRLAPAARVPKHPRAAPVGVAVGGLRLRLLGIDR